MVELLTDREVARLLKSSAKTVRNLARRGAFPKPLKLGRLTRWRRAEVERYIETGEVETGGSR